MNYRFITNLKKSDLKYCYLAITAAEIKDYVFYEETYDAFSQPLKDHYALYVSNHTSEKELELFHKAYIMIKDKERAK